jgi:hypothetical protein
MSSVVGHSLLIVGLVLFANSYLGKRVTRSHIALLCFWCCVLHEQCPRCRLRALLSVWRAGSPPFATDYFLPAYLIIGVAGTPIQLAVLHICNEFENNATAMAFYAGTYAASSCVFVIFKV